MTCPVADFNHLFSSVQRFTYWLCSSKLSYNACINSDLMSTTAERSEPTFVNKLPNFSCKHPSFLIWANEIPHVTPQFISLHWLQVQSSGTRGRLYCTFLLEHKKRSQSKLFRLVVPRWWKEPANIHVCIGPHSCSVKMCLTIALPHGPTCNSLPW